MANRSIAERFLEKVNKNGPVPAICPERGNCWEWTGFCYPTGHGQFYMDGRRNIKASRAAWLIFVGDPGESYVCHHCDNPKCVRLEHLYLGTHQTNMQDRATRTHWQKYRRKTTKLAWREVREIRAILRDHQKQWGVSQYQQVADTFGVNVNTVSRIMRNWNWKEEDDPERLIQ